MVMGCVTVLTKATQTENHFNNPHASLSITAKPPEAVTAPAVVKAPVIVAVSTNDGL
jgi:hypothetical protein